MPCYNACCSTKGETIVNSNHWHTYEQEKVHATRIGTTVWEPFCLQVTAAAHLWSSLRGTRLKAPSISAFQREGA